MHNPGRGLDRRPEEAVALLHLEGWSGDERYEGKSRQREKKRHEGQKCMAFEGNSYFNFLELSTSQEMVDAVGKVDRSGLRRFGRCVRKFRSHHKGAALEDTVTPMQGTGLKEQHKGWESGEPSSGGDS